MFNFDLPTNIDDYIHRVGRTGRCGNTGNALSFFNENNSMLLKDLYQLFVKLKQEIPSWFEQMYKKHSNEVHTQKYNKYKNNSNHSNQQKLYNKPERFETEPSKCSYYSSNSTSSTQSYKLQPSDDSLQFPKFYNSLKDGTNSLVNNSSSTTITTNDSSKPNNNAGVSSISSGNINNKNIISINNDSQIKHIEKSKVINNGSDYKNNLNKFNKNPIVTNEKFPRANYNNSSNSTKGNENSK